MPTEPTTAPPPSVSHSEVYTYLINNKGISRNHALGIINNLQAESNMQYGVEIDDPSQLYTSSGGTRGTIARSGGLAQWRGSRLEALKQYMIDNHGEGADYKENWRAQIDYMLTENETQTYLNKDFATPEAASKDWTYYWEVPGDRGEIQYFYDGEEYVMARNKRDAIRKIKELNPNIDIKRKDLRKGEILGGKAEQRILSLSTIIANSKDLGGFMQPETVVEGGTPVTEGEIPSSILAQFPPIPNFAPADKTSVNLPKHRQDYIPISPFMEMQRQLAAADDVEKLLPQNDQANWKSGILEELFNVPLGRAAAVGGAGAFTKFNFNDWMDNLLIPKKTK